jgi:hypothetical protein
MVLSQVSDRPASPEVPAKLPRSRTRYTGGMKIVRLWVPLCLAGLLLGCGQKGPLVQPDTPKHKKVTPGPAGAPPANTTRDQSGTTTKP